VCLYTASTATGLPQTLVTDPGIIAIGSGSVTGPETGTVAGGGVAIGGAWYWTAFLADSNSESVTSYTGATGGALSSIRINGYASLAFAIAGTVTVGVSGTQAFGSCPATFPSPAFADNTAIPYIFMGY